MRGMRILFLSCLVLLICGCNKDRVAGISGEEESCSVSFALETDYTLHEVGLTRAPLPEEKAFKVRIENTRAEVLAEWDYENLPSLIKVVPGSYKLVGWFGTDTVLPAFEAPYYYGETKITLKEGDELDTLVPVSMAVTKVAVTFDESFDFDYDDYFVEIKTVGDSLRFSKEEKREAYFVPGKLRMRFGLKPIGSEAYYEFYPEAIAHAKAKEFYNMTLKAESKNGALSMITITTDTSTIQIPVDVELPAFYLPKDAPSVNLSADDMVAGILETTEGVSKNAVAMIYAPGGMTELILKTVSDSLLARGWPAEIDLMNLTDEQEALLKANGLDWSEEIDQKDTIKTSVWVNFNDVVKLLNTAPGQSTISGFEILTKDQFQQEGNVCSFQVKVSPPVFEFAKTPGEGNVWAKKAVYDVKYVSEIRTPVVECKGSDGNWTALATALTETSADVYHCVGKGLTPNTDYAFRVRLGEHVLDAGNYRSEADAQVGNHGFEEWYTTSEKEWYWTLKLFYYYPWSNGSSDVWWATNNEYAQDWTVSPFEVNACPAVIYVKDVKEGTRAAELHTTGHGGGYASTGAVMYPESARAGRLFIGKYAWDGKNETVTTGHAFASRPTTMSFWYKYTPYNSDNFKAEIELRNNGTVIATGSFVSALTSTADTEYKEARVDLTYTNTELKATEIYINILSTTRTSFESGDLQKGGRIDLTDCESDWTVHIGSRLKVDAISLIYE